ncbi:MAG: undecaprenyl/decaprenyl-phosphate alpha-N-acetylglucosaminyl 1-phosphate transferase, partial [Thermoguttaceae bacterium]|nr:undecaprenyl/decaprenyl-phosphate alpha-N-acetylglucosaminyl 1-phosphate transferase [Thermoguttaceae bacterium]
MTWLVAGAIVPSLLVTWAAAWGVRRLGPKLGLIDKPGYRKVHAAAMPTAGGLAIWLGIVVPLAAGQLALWYLLFSGASVAEIEWVPQFARAHLS